MSRAEDWIENVEDPLIELLAIKLFEHDNINGRAPKTPNLGWMAMANEDRESFREMARGKEPIGYQPDE